MSKLMQLRRLVDVAFGLMHRCVDVAFGLIPKFNGALSSIKFAQRWLKFATQFASCYDVVFVLGNLSLGLQENL